MSKKQITILLILTLLTGCIGTTASAATLEDSMLKPPSSTEASGDKDESTSVFSSGSDTITQAASLVDLPQDDRVQRIGEMCQQDYEKTGVLASVSAAQCILESGYLTSELATGANNCFGMKTNLSDNSWDGSTWDGTSVYTKQTGEEFDGNHVTIVADFRQYDSIEDSVADHSAYLLGATVDDGQLRYAGLAGETDYKTAIQIIKDGGYATSSTYVDKICSIIERFDLTRFDEITTESDTKTSKKKASKVGKKSSRKVDDELYRVRLSWEDADSQLGAFKDLDNAREACRSGYSVYDADGNAVYKAE